MRTKVPIPGLALSVVGSVVSTASIRRSGSMSQKGDERGMREQYVSRLAVIAVSMWVVAGSFLAGSWAAYFLVGDGPFLPRLCAWSAAVFALAALAVHIRRMTCRVLALIRHASGLDSGERESLRVLR